MARGEQSGRGSGLGDRHLPCQLHVVLLAGGLLGDRGCNAHAHQILRQAARRHLSAAATPSFFISEITSVRAKALASHWAGCRTSRWASRRQRRAQWHHHGPCLAPHAADDPWCVGLRSLSLNVDAHPSPAMSIITNGMAGMAWQGIR